MSPAVAIIEAVAIPLATPNVAETVVPVLYQGLGAEAFPYEPVSVVTVEQTGPTAVFGAPNIQEANPSAPVAPTVPVIATSVFGGFVSNFTYPGPSRRFGGGPGF
jgi:hypothetical protein